MTSYSDQFKENHNNNDDQLKVSSVEIFEADTRLNIDIQVATAQKFKRHLPTVLENILFLATQDKETADKCFYTLKRDGKTIRGASIRLAEIISNCYGNLRASARIVANDGRTVTAQGICWDLENNVAYSIEVKRKITNKDGRVFSEDMQVVTSNACCSIALRNAIFKCVPLGITNSVQEKIKKVMMGDEKDFTTIRRNAVTYFEELGVTEKNILAVFDKKSVDELSREDVFDLRGIATAILDGDTTLELAFSITPKGNALGKASKILSVPIEPLNEDLNLVSKENRLDDKDEKIQDVIDKVQKHEMYPNEAVAAIDEINEDAAMTKEEVMKTITEKEEVKVEAPKKFKSEKPKDKKKKDSTEGKGNSKSTLFEIEE